MRHMAFSKASHVSMLGGVFLKNTAETTFLKANLGRLRSAGNASLRSKFAPCNIARFQQVRAPDGSGANNLLYNVLYTIHYTL